MEDSLVSLKPSSNQITNYDKLTKNVNCKRLLGLDLSSDCKSSQSVLCVTTASFFIFITALWFGALLSNSLSLTADAIAMTVDVITYMTNMTAENLKVRQSGRVSAKKMFLFEVIVPSFSCLALLGTGAWISIGAWSVILHPEEDTGKDVNIATLYTFSSINFFVDMLSIWMFYRKGKTIFEYQSAPSSTPAEGTAEIAKEAKQPSDQSFDVDKADQNAILPPFLSPQPIVACGAGETQQTANSDPIGVTPPVKNVNMMSAFMHVGADTVRTCAVFFAAVVASSGQNGSICDAWAAQVCTLTVLFMVVPVVREIVRSCGVLVPAMRQEARVQAMTVQATETGSQDKFEDM